MQPLSVVLRSRFYCAWLLMVLAAPALAFESAPYFPLSAGQQWIYKSRIQTGPRTSLPFIGLNANSRRDGTKTIVTKSGDIYNDIRTTLIDSNNSWDAVHELFHYRNDFEGITLHFYDRQPSGGIQCGPLLQALKYLPPLVELGLTYRSEASIPCSGSGFNWIIKWDVTIKLLGYEQVKVPAGTFDALKMERTVVYNYSTDMRLKQTDFDRLWLAQGIGVVKAEGRVTNHQTKEVIDTHGDELISTSLKRK